MSDKLITKPFPQPILRIDEKILALKKKKERIQTQQALLFSKEAQKILKDDFTPEIALLILSEAWVQASKALKEEWRKRGGSFRDTQIQADPRETPPVESKSHKS